MSWSAIRSSMRSTLRLLQVRLRIPIVLVLAALVVGRWDVLRNYWDKLTRTQTAESLNEQSVSSDIEYFCPMDPGVVSNWPNKCGVCNMTLVQRRRGEATMLPDGVIARMQISPYRVQLAGVLTSPVGFHPLAQEARATGPVRRQGGKAMCQVDVPARQAPWIKQSQPVVARCRDLAGRTTFAGHVAAVERVDNGGWEALRCSVEIDDPDGRLRPGMMVGLTFQVSVAGLEPFRSQSEASNGRKAGELVEIFTCSDHPEELATRDGRCPRDGNRLVLRPLADHESVQWWCPLHPKVTANAPGASCAECGGMVLKPRILTTRPRGQVLAVPESSVVDTGTRTVVFVESMPGTFDGVEVVLGPRCGDFFPVIKGLQAGQRIALTGAFLLDAETRLNPSLASGYFGAVREQVKREAAPSATTVQRATSAEADVSGSGASTAESLTPKQLEAIAGLAQADRLLAERQRICPVTRLALGSMGKPPCVEVDGKAVFLCCEGCMEKFRKDAARYMAELGEPEHP